MIYLPSACLLLAVFAFFAQRRLWAFISVLAAFAVGLVTGEIGWVALPSAALLFGSLALAESVRLRRHLFARVVSYVVFVALAVALSMHLVPGFHNRLVIDHVRLASDSRPFTMYLNFDMTLVGLAVALCFLRVSGLMRKQLAVAAQSAGLLIALMIPLALIAHYVRWNPKWPEATPLWMLNNLFFVAFAEEALFRGFVEEGLLRLWNGRRARLAIGISALLFGLAHYQGGWRYIAFASLAGLAYGHVYWKTRRLEASMLVHFSLNLAHFLFFSYPSL